MGRIERAAYAAGAKEEAFMEEAGRGVAQYAGYLHKEKKITLLCGNGNNAGDAYVAGRLLQERGYSVKAYSLSPLEKCTPLCQLQAKRFGKVNQIVTADELELEGLLIDGILGTGFYGVVDGLFRDMIEKANASKLPILSIDIPSGVNGTTGEVGGVAIRATFTLFLGLPKTGCFFAWEQIGRFAVHNFGLAKELVDQACADFILVDEQMVRDMLPPIKRTRHKYEAGYVVGLGGSPGMPGAPILASFAALRSGAGIVRLLHPAGMESELAAAPPEIIRQGYHSAAEILQIMERASSCFIGPGIGTSPKTLALLQEVLPKLNKPCVIDAEALTLIAAHQIPLPPQAIITPHYGEMKRLLHREDNPPVGEFHAACKAYVEKMQITLVLKGAPTFIFPLTGKPYISACGDPGMATAGSGDVLTGIVAAFLASTHDPLQAALLANYFHGRAGELAALDITSPAMVASDITHALPLVFEELL